MFDSAFQAIEKVITDFTWKRILVYLFIILTFIGIILSYEYHTRSFELGKIERVTELLNTLEISSTSENEEIKKITSNILARLESFIIIEDSESLSGFSQEYIQGFAGAAPWLLFLLLYTPFAIHKKEDDWGYGVLGLGVIAIIIGAVAYSLPIISSNWLRFGLVQLANCIIFSGFWYLGNKDED